MANEVAKAVSELIDPALGAQMMGGAYEGASKMDTALALWSPPMQSADAGILPGKDQMDARVKDVTRNDGYVQAGANLHKDNIVGSMFLMNAKPNLLVLGLGKDETWETEFQEEVESKFTLWAESLDNWPDASRVNTLTAQVRLAVGIYASAGEVLSTIEWMKGPSRPYRTAVQMIDLDRLRTPMEYMDDEAVRGGIRRNKNGEALGYYIHKSHPYDFGFGVKPDEHIYVKTRRQRGRLQVIYIHEQQRPDQTRGVSEIVAGLKELRITKKFRDVTLQNAVVNASFAATIESELPPEAVMAGLGGGNIGNTVADYGAEYLGAVNEYVGNARHMKIDGVKIPHLFPGTKLSMQPAGKIGGVGQDFEKSLIRHLAAILGVGYEQLSKDYTETNYSSARAAMVETWKFMMSRKKMVAERYASSVYRAWFEEAANKRPQDGGLETLQFSKVPNIYDGMNMDAYTQCDWIGASRGQIDELKETQAAVLRIKYGLSTHEDELAKLGKDWRKVYAQLEREAKDRETRNIELFEDNSVNAASGAVRESDDDNGRSAKEKVDG